MEIHLTAVVQEHGLPITHCFWSDGGWVSFNGETKQWHNHGYVPRPSHFPKLELADAPRHTAEVAVDD
jgi:hypothetical protein